jgi:uncharacterized protein (DUF302 family)
MLTSACSSGPTPFVGHRPGPTGSRANRTEAQRRHKPTTLQPHPQIKGALMLLRTAILATFALLLALPPVQAQELALETDERRIYSIEGEFDFYREMVESAITDEGMVINAVGLIAQMLDRTGGDLGGGKRIYLNGESVEFCSAIYSRRMMEADPHTVVFCPYVIAIYELADEPGTIYIGYQRVPIVGDEASRSALQEVEDLLDRVVNNAMAF